MKKQFIYIICIGMLFLLTACPFGTPFPPGPKGALPLDEQLIGTWECDTAMEARRVSFIKGEQANIYRLNVDEPGSLYMPATTTFDAWLAALGNFRFIVIEEKKADGTAPVFYAYQYYFKRKKLISIGMGSMVEHHSMQDYQADLIRQLSEPGYMWLETTWRKVSPGK